MTASDRDLPDGSSHGRAQAARDVARHGLSTPSAEHLRERCLAEGVDPGADDLEGVMAFLDTLLPALGRIEASLGPEMAVAALFLPEGGER